MNYIKFSKFDTANGPGIRITLWVTGCEHHCVGCHNKNTWEINQGIEFDNSAMNEVLEFLSRPFVRGITFSGGDPLHTKNREGITKVAKKIKEVFGNTKDIWCYTGYSYESIKDLEVMKYIDVLVDGEYIESLRDITLTFCGSKNQRIIDVQKSRSQGKVILY